MFYNLKASKSYDLTNSTHKFVSYLKTAEGQRAGKTGRWVRYRVSRNYTHEEKREPDN